MLATKATVCCTLNRVVETVSFAAESPLVLAGARIGSLMIPLIAILQD